MKILRRIAAVVLILAVVIFAYYGLSLRTFYRSAGSDFDLPGLGTGFDQQGLCQEDGIFWMTGYIKGGRSADPLYYLEDGTWHKVLLLNEDGSAFTGHAGGMAVHGEYVYIAGSSDDCLYVYSKQEALEAQEGEGIRCLGSFPTALSGTDGVKASYLTIGDGMLFVGEFHFPILPHFALRDNHRIGNNSAIIAGFPLEEDGVFGISPTPSVVYSIGDLAQGVAVRDGLIYLSTSLFLPDSHFQVFRADEAESAGTMTLLGAEVPVYTLKTAADTITAPPFAEEVELVGDRLYITSELQDMFFKSFGNLWGAAQCRYLQLNEDGTFLRK